MVATANTGPWSIRDGGHMILLQEQDGYSKLISLLEALETLKITLKLKKMRKILKRELSKSPAIVFSTYF